MDEETLSLLLILLARLERISADSYLAHRASGVRGSLLRFAERIEGGKPVHRSDLTRTMNTGFTILEKAARERVK